MEAASCASSATSAAAETTTPRGSPGGSGGELDRADRLERCRTTASAGDEGPVLRRAARRPRARGNRRHRNAPGSLPARAPAPRRRTGPAPGRSAAGRGIRPGSRGRSGPPGRPAARNEPVLGSRPASSPAAGEHVGATVARREDEATSGRSGAASAWSCRRRRESDREARSRVYLSTRRGSRPLSGGSVDHPALATPHLRFRLRRRRRRSRRRLGGDRSRPGAIASCCSSASASPASTSASRCWRPPTRLSPTLGIAERMRPPISRRNGGPPLTHDGAERPRRRLRGLARGRPAADLPGLPAKSSTASCSSARARWGSRCAKATASPRCEFDADGVADRAPKPAAPRRLARPGASSTPPAAAACWREVRPAHRRAEARQHRDLLALHGRPRLAGDRPDDIRLVARADAGWFWLIPINDRADQRRRRDARAIYMDRRTARPRDARRRHSPTRRWSPT